MRKVSTAVGCLAAATAATLTTLLALASGALAQSGTAVQGVERYVPRIPARDTAPTITGPEVPRGATDTTPLIPALRGIVIVGRPEGIVKSGTGGQGIVVRDDRVPVPERVRAAIQPYLGRPVSLKSISEMTNAIVVAYRDEDLPVVNVVAPAQEITNGTLQLIIVVGRLGQLRVEGARYVAPGLYLDNSTLEPGHLIYGSELLDDLRWLNRSPFRRVDAIYTPGKAFGTTDIVLRPFELRPFTVYAGVNNDGNRTLGLERPFIGAMAANTLGLNEVLGYQLTTDKNFSNLFAHAVTAQIPVTRRSELQFTGTYVTSDANINQDFRSSGVSSSIGSYYLMQLPRFYGIANDLRFGYEHKQTNNNLEFGGTLVSNTTAAVDQFVVGWSGEKIWSLGHTKLNASVFFSPGDITSDNTTANFQQLRAGAKADYTYSRFGLDHRIDLPLDWRVNFSVLGQVANANLLASESLSLGGPGSVRGFESNITRADTGAVSSLTLYTPGISVAGPVEMTDYLANFPKRYDNSEKLASEVVRDQLRGLVFVDYGWGRSHSPLTGEIDRRLASSGVGVIYELGRYFSAEIAYGWQLEHEGFTQKDNNGFLHFRATTRY